MHMIKNYHPQSVLMKTRLGSGQFGIVYRGVWQQTADSEEDSGVEVAVKTMEEGAGEEERVKFLQEAAIMGQFKNHPNIVRILGIILDAPVSNNTSGGCSRPINDD